MVQEDVFARIALLEPDPERAETARQIAEEYPGLTAEEAIERVKGVIWCTSPGPAEEWD